jgi:hypothetical protein
MIIDETNKVEIIVFKEYIIRRTLILCLAVVGLCQVTWGFQLHFSLNKAPKNDAQEPETKDVY